MRRWFNRFGLLFLLAGWAWLAVGLYRQIPRDLGPVVFRPNLDAGERLEGFVGRKPVVLTYQNSFLRRDQDPAFWLWDVKTKSAALRNDRLGVFGNWATEFSTRRDFAIAAGRLSDGKQAPGESAVLDLMTDVRFRLPVADHRAIFHPQKPLAIFRTSAGERRGLAVFDLKTGARLFDWPPAGASPVGNHLQADPVFLGDHGVAIATRTWGDHALEVWEFSRPDKPAQRFEGIQVGSDVVASQNGRRIAWHDGDSYNVRMFDLGAGRIVFAEQPEPEGSIRRLAMGLRGPVLSQNGRSVLAPMSGRLFDVDTDRVLWSADEDEAPIYTWDNRLFETRESWTLPIGLRTRKLDTHTVRDLRDGSFVYRTWQPTLGYWRAEDESGDAYIFGADGAVHALPPVVNWLLVAGAEAALASPLVIAAAIAWWRRGRGRRVEERLS